MTILTIDDEEKRLKLANQIIDEDETRRELVNAYLELARKNQSEDFKAHTRFLKIFPQYFTYNTQDFYSDPEVTEIKKLLLSLNIRFNIFELSTLTQACFWFMLFNFMTPINAEIEITTARRKILTEKYCRKTKADSRTLQNTFRALEKSGLILKTKKDKHTVTYVVPLISATRSFTKSYTELNLNYLELVHQTQVQAIKTALKNSNKSNNKMNLDTLDTEKIKKNISEKMTDELINRVSCKNKSLKLKVTYELECDSQSGEINFGNLVDVVNIKPVIDEIPKIGKKDLTSITIGKFTSSGYKLNKEQIIALTECNLGKLSQEYKTNPDKVKKTIRSTRTIGRKTYKNLVEFLSISNN